MAKNARQLAADVMTARLASELGAPGATAGLHYYAWTLGPDVCEQLMRQALAMADSADECMWTSDGRRPRTAAGTFFILARHAFARRKQEAS